MLLNNFYGIDFKVSPYELMDLTIRAMKVKQLKQELKKRKLGYVKLKHRSK